MAPAKQSQPQSAMEALLAAVAAAPDLTREIAALKSAQADYDNIRQKAGEAHATDYAGELNSTHAALVAARARHDIGRATDEELAAAKAAYAAAQEKADMAPGRRAVLMEELEQSRDAIQSALEALDDAKAEWASTVTDAARAAELEALRLLVSASKALHMADPYREWVGTLQILEALPHYSEAFAGGGAVNVVPEAVEPGQIAYSLVVSRRALRSLEYVPDMDRLGRAIASTREEQLSPQSIEKARTAALLKANGGNVPPVQSMPPQVGMDTTSAVIGAGSGKVPYSQF